MKTDTNNKLYDYANKLRIKTSKYYFFKVYNWSKMGSPKMEIVTLQTLTNVLNHHYAQKIE